MLISFLFYISRSEKLIYVRGNSYFGGPKYSLSCQGVFTIKIGHSGGFVTIGHFGPTVQYRVKNVKFVDFFA